MNAVNNSPELTQIEIRKLKKEMKMCEGKRHFLWTRGVFACLLLSSFSYAGKVETIVVDSGYVVAYGKYILPPYRITLKYGPLVNFFPEKDSIFINGIPYRPSLQRPYHKCTPEGIHELVREYGIIDDSLCKFIGKYGVRKARSKAESFLKKQSFVVKEWDLHGNEWDIRFYYEVSGEIRTNGIKMLLLTEAGRMTREKMCKQVRKKYKDEFEDMVKALKSGGLAIFGYNRARTVIQDNPKEHLLEIKAILKRSASDSLKNKLLLENGLIKDNLLREELLENEEEWENLKLDEEQNE
ncbi:hypothetical protein KAW50_02775 [candidate division WOR-3 bacterium]|nr:hypothetical protein [candidate division WOR-3 bacterium]